MIGLYETPRSIAGTGDTFAPRNGARMWPFLVVLSTFFLVIAVLDVVAVRASIPVASVLVADPEAPGSAYSYDPAGVSNNTHAFSPADSLVGSTASNR